MFNSDPFAIAFVACLIVGMIAIISPIRMLGLTRFRGLLLVAASATFIFLSTDFQHRFFHQAAVVQTAMRPMLPSMGGRDTSGLGMVTPQSLVAYQKPDQRSDALKLFISNYPAPDGWIAPDFNKPVFAIKDTLLCDDKATFRKIYDILVDDHQPKLPNFMCYVLSGKEKLNLLSVTSDNQMLQAQIVGGAGTKPKTGWVLATEFRN